MAQLDGATVGAVIAVQAAHQGRFAGAGRTGQHDAFAGMDLQVDAGQHRHSQAAAQVQGEALRQRPVRSMTVMKSDLQ